MPAGDLVRFIAFEGSCSGIPGDDVTRAVDQQSQAFLYAGFLSATFSEAKQARGAGQLALRRAYPLTGSP